MDLGWKNAALIAKPGNGYQEFPALGKENLVNNENMYKNSMELQEAIRLLC